MSQPASSAEIQRHVGSPIYAENVKLPEKNVIFYGTTTTFRDYAESPTDYTEIADTHNAFQQSSGQFIAPKGNVQRLSIISVIKLSGY